MQRTYKKSKEVLQGARGKIKFPITTKICAVPTCRAAQYFQITNRH